MLHGSPSQLWLLPVFFAIMILFASAVALIASFLDIWYRDFVFLLPFLAQIIFVASPIVYGREAAPEIVQWFGVLNPLSSVISGFRWILLSGPALSFNDIFVSFMLAVLFYLFGLFLYWKTDAKIAEVI